MVIPLTVVGRGVVMKHRSMHNWMNNNYMHYKTATELTSAAMNVYRMICADDETYDEVYDMALSFIKEP